MQSIPKTEPEQSPQNLLGERGYPCVMIHHWFAMAQWPVTKMRGYLESCQGPTPEAEERRQIYLDVLWECEHLLQVSLSSEIRDHLAREEARLQHACDLQATRKVGVRRRKTIPTQKAAAD